jgi:hypothetical protein
MLSSVRRLLHVISMKTHVATIIVPADEGHPEFAMLVRHSEPNRPRACNMLSSTSHV